MTDIATPDTQPTTPEDSAAPLSKARIEYTPEQQAHLQTLIDAAVARAKKGASTEVETLRQKAARLDELEEAQKTELQKAQEAADRYRQEAEQAQATIKEAAVRQTVFEAAVAGNAVNAAQVFALIKADLQEGDDVAAAVGAFLEANPHFVKPTGPTVPHLAPAPGLGTKTAEPGIMSRDDYLKDPDLLKRAKASREWHAKHSA
jgi:ABC-type transporter Mla subunit MlaD